MDLISIIVPIYNVENYLCECIDSICSQTYQNLEIILVNDGSVDNCPNICDRYKLKDSRIKVLHQPHQGPSVARNKGYESASGSYIGFVDSDDKIADTFVESLYRLMKKHTAQIAACAYTCNPDRLEKKVVSDHVMTSETMLKGWHGRYKRMETVVWNKLYERQILETFPNGKLFPEGKIHEDTYVSHLFVACAQRIAVTPQKLYFYRKRKESISRVYTKEAVRDDFDAQRARLNFFRERKLYGAYFRLFIGHLLHWIKYLKINKKQKVIKNNK